MLLKTKSLKHIEHQRVAEIAEWVQDRLTTIMWVMVLREMNPKKRLRTSRIIQTINPIAFSKYLKDTNWQVLPIKRSDIGIFQKTIDDNLFQVTVPMDSSLIDYAYAMHEAVEKVAFCNNQTLEQLVLYLINPNSDVLKIRLDRKDIDKLLTHNTV